MQFLIIVIKVLIDQGLLEAIAEGGEGIKTMKTAIRIHFQLPFIHNLT